MDEVERTAKTVQLSKADVMRQSMKLGLPRLREQLSAKSGRVTNVEPLPKAILNRLYKERDDDTEAIKQFIAAQPFHEEED